MDLGLRDRVYLVTGGSRGLGRAAAQILVAEGARVIVAARDEEAITKTAIDLGGTASAVGLVGDLGDPTAAERLVAAAVARYGQLNGALISVGGPPIGTVMEIPDEAWRDAFDTIFLGALRLARAVAHTVASNGSIVFVLSSTVRTPVAYLGISNGLRPGLAMVAKSLADELGPRGIRVNGLLPGRIDTSRVRELDQATGDAAAAQAQAVKGIPLGRYGDPEEFARVAAFVLSPAASYLTGAMIPVDGGAIRAL